MLRLRNLPRALTCERTFVLARSNRLKFSSTAPGTPTTAGVATAGASASSSGATATTTATVEGHYKPGIFSRNPGVVFGAFIAVIGTYLYRGNVNGKHFTATQDEIADHSAISPYEAYELRSANAITFKEFAAILNDLHTVFPSGQASFQSFDAYLGEKLREVCPTGIKHGYHLERVLLNLPICAESQSESESDSESPKPNDAHVPSSFVLVPRQEQLRDVRAMTTAFSLAVSGTVDERLMCLFGLMTRHQNDHVESAKNSAHTPTDKDVEVLNVTHGHDAGTRLMSKQSLIQVVEYATQSCQLPSEKRVYPLLHKKKKEEKETRHWLSEVMTGDSTIYPFQQYHLVSSERLVEEALHAAIKADKYPADLLTHTAATEPSFTFEEFTELLKSKQVCIWGECFTQGSQRRLKN